jgi:hypothetical protein
MAQDGKIAWRTAIYGVVAIIITIGGVFMGASLHHEYVLNSTVEQVGMTKVLTNQPSVTEAEVRESVIRLTTKYNLSLKEAGTVVITVARIRNLTDEQRMQVESIVAARAKLCTTGGLDFSKLN